MKIFLFFSFLLLQKLRLESIWACPVFETTDKTALQDSDKGLSTGSVLVIIFFVFIILYFVGGAVALRLLRGAEGKEMIPNYDFWVDLPNLVRVSVYTSIVVIIFCCFSSFGNFSQQ
jgi:hypothetical protein